MMGSDIVTLSYLDLFDVVGVSSLNHRTMENVGISLSFLKPLNFGFLSPGNFLLTMPLLKLIGEFFLGWRALHSIHVKFPIVETPPFDIPTTSGHEICCQIPSYSKI
jgi:hypothetical protein